MSKSESSPSIDREKLENVIYEIRVASSNGILTRESSLFQVSTGLTEEDKEEFFIGLSSEPELKDIVSLRGKKDCYYYSKEKMTENYANMVFRIEEKDLLRGMAELIRKESNIYPRPTSLMTFYLKPFSFEKEFLKELVEKLQGASEYSDIEETKASNGAVYLYSNRFLTKNNAKSLAEWIEVGQYENP